jgi:hypothetical protein
LLPLLEIRSTLSLPPAEIPLLLWLLLRLRLCLRLLLRPLLRIRPALLPAEIPLLLLLLRLRLCLRLLLPLLEVRATALLLRSEVRTSLLNLPWPRSLKLSIPRVRLRARCAATALGPDRNTRHLRRHPVFRRHWPRSDYLRRTPMIGAECLLPVV